VPPDRIRVIPNAINPARFHGVDGGESMKKRLGLSGKIVLGFTGFMREWHRLDTILDLLAATDTRPELHLLLVGDGPTRKLLEDRTRQLGLESRVTFVGLIDHDEVTHFVAAFDIALQPATVNYASPLKLFEYMALGKAIVAPNQPNIREILTHEVDALLFEPGSPEAMATAILRLAEDAPLRDKLGRSARATIANRHLTWTDNAAQVSEIAMMLLQRYQRTSSVDGTFSPTAKNID
jgi:glycosyltransferase involved in cell wall biosynthesis